MKYLELYEQFEWRKKFAKPDDAFVNKVYNAVVSEFNMNNLEVNSSIIFNYYYIVDDDIKIAVFPKTQSFMLMDRKEGTHERLDVSENVVKKFVDLFEKKTKEKLGDVDVQSKRSKIDKIKSKFRERDPDVTLESFIAEKKSRLRKNTRKNRTRKNYKKRNRTRKGYKKRNRET